MKKNSGDLLPTRVVEEEEMYGSDLEWLLPGHLVIAFDLRRDPARLMEEISELIDLAKRRREA